MNKNLDEINPNMIAVIGIACRFPGAKNIDEFWFNLKHGIESISYFSEEEAVNSGVDKELAKNSSFVKAFGVIEESDKFDAEFFGFSPREAELLDPQTRMFLECSWEAFENAAYDTDRIDGRVGVYASSSLSSYLMKNLLSNKETLLSTGGVTAQLGNDKDHIPTRVSYVMNLKGPSISVGTACSSSLVAVHLACQGLLDYHCDVALAGGVTIHANQTEGYVYGDEGTASPDGHCRTFDSRSGGFVSGSGVGTVILKRLKDAIRDNDNIYAVVLSSAVNNDGALRVSYAAPGIEGQSEVIAEAQNLADIDPDTITYIETHGTATKLGDTIEIEALKKVFNSVTDKKSFCAIGSVKSNIGHLDSAAGIAGFIKTVLSLKNKQIPPSIHFENKNQALKIDDSPFYVNNKLTDWVTNGIPRRAGVSSFAMGGTNAHVILQEAQENIPAESGNDICVIPISAKTENSVNNYLRKLSEDLSVGNKRLNDAAYTFQMGRKPFKYRKALVVGNIEELLNDFDSNKPKNIYTGTTDSSNTDIVFMFSGLGSHYVNMGLNLFNSNKVFHENLIRCSYIFKSITGDDLLNIMYPDGTEEKKQVKGNNGIDFLKMVRGNEAENKSKSKLDKTINAHPAIFAIEYALAQMCLDFGIKPSVLIGHSIGEYTALCISGILSLEDTLKVIIKRARILDAVQTGEMLTVDTTENNIMQYLTDSLSLAAVNDSSSCVIAGLKDEIDNLKDKLNAASIVHRPVNTKHAFHSKLIDEKKKELNSIFEGVVFNKTNLPIISSSTGNWLSEEEILNSDYWVSQTIGTVQFYKGIQKLFDENYKHFLELGPGQNLAGFVLKSNPKSEKRKIFVQTTMKNIYDNQPDYEYFMRTIAKLWVVGIDIEWENLYKESKPRRIPLPAYPFEHKRYWIDEKINSRDNLSDDEKNGISYLTWKKSFSRLPVLENTDGDSTWLIFKDPHNNIEILENLLKEKGIKYLPILLSDINEFTGQNKYTIDTGKKNSFVKLFKWFEKNNIQYKNIVYLPFLDKELEQAGYDITLISELLKVLSLTNKNINISFILENAFNITGTEIINPASSALFGLIKSIPEEIKNIKSYCFEYTQLNSQDTKDFYVSMLNSVMAETNENFTAFRGKSKWIPCYNQLSKVNVNKTEDKEKILLLGNNYKLKNIIAGELNNKKNKQFIITSKKDKDEYINNDFISITEKQIDKILSIKSIEDYECLHTKLDKLCGVMAVKFLSQLFEWKVGEETSIETLRSKVIVKHRKFLDYLLSITVEDGYIKIVNDKLIVKIGMDEIGSPDMETQKIKKEYAVVSGMIKILEYAVSTYYDVFFGKMENVDVFNNNELEIFDDIFQITPYRFEKQKVYINAARSLLNVLLENNSGKKVNILEVGGGTGKLTVNLLADLMDKNVEYHFTDISKSFIVDAKKLTKKLNIDFMKFDKFDISQDPRQQGIELTKYDIVLAYDVIHAVDDVEKSMKNLEMVMAPGGVMIVIEYVHPRRWANMTWGLQTGWWYFDDFRNKNMSPLITLDEWDIVLNKLSMSYSATYPVEEPRRSNTAFGLIAAQKKGGADQNINDLRNLSLKLDKDFNHNFAYIENYINTSSGLTELTNELKKLKEDYGHVDSIYICEDNIGSVPVIVRDYENYKDTAEAQINRINMFISAIKDSGLLRGKLNIIFEKTNNCFHSDELIVSEYINSLGCANDFDITSAFIDKEYLNSPNEIDITGMVSEISSTQIYFTKGGFGRDKRRDKKQKVIKQNTYSRPDLNTAYTGPRNDIEKKLTAIWNVMFGIDQIGIYDNFFELGGDSLMATKIITRIKQEFNVLIKLPVFFQNPTIETIGEKITSNKNMIDILTSRMENSSTGREEGEI